jgi:hypothetical protein
MEKKINSSFKNIIHFFEKNKRKRKSKIFTDEVLNLIEQINNLYLEFFCHLKNEEDENPKEIKTVLVSCYDVQD